MVTWLPRHLEGVIICLDLTWRILHKWLYPFALWIFKQDLYLPVYNFLDIKTHIWAFITSHFIAKEEQWVQGCAVHRSYYTQPSQKQLAPLESMDKVASLERRPCEDGVTLNQGPLCATMSSLDGLLCCKTRFGIRPGSSTAMTSLVNLCFFVLMQSVSVLDNLMPI